VERTVKKVLGEDGECKVSLLTNSLSILLFNEKIDEKTLEKKLEEEIKKSGYTLLTNKEENRKKEKKEWSGQLVRLVFSAVFTLAIMYLAMGGMIGLKAPVFLRGSENAVWMALAQFILTLPVLILNFKFFRNGFLALLHRAPNMDSLVAIGSGASVLYGIVSIFLLLGAGESNEVRARLLHDLYFESAAMILTLVSLGKLLEARAKEKAADAVKALASLTPKFAVAEREGAEVTVKVEEIEVGEILIIRVGDMIPCDGEVIEGEGSTDESALTGESLPVEKAIGMKVSAASVLTDGFLKIRAVRVGEETSLSRIVRLVEDAAASKAPIARVADRVSAVFVPIVMAISAVTLTVWMILTGNVEQSLRSAIAVLVISCPCALGLATPTAITVGIGRGARLGILFRSAEALEKLCSAKVFLFDKTGTVTVGEPALTEAIGYEVDERELIGIAASVEKMSSHPLAIAVVRAAEERGIEFFSACGFRSLTGIGAEAEIGGSICRVGKPTEEDRVGAMGEAIFSLESAGQTVVVVKKGDKALGILGISDRIREDSREAILKLREEHCRCVMLTGDNERTAATVAKKAGLDDYRAGLLPEDKEKIVGEMRKDGVCVMIGDGINDAPALVRADVGIAIGAGTEVAIDCAGVVLSGNSLLGVARAYRLSRATVRIVRQNLFWALIYNVICIPIAAGVLYPLLGWQLSPMLASAAMSFSSVCVVTNALRLRRVRLMKQTNTNEEKGEEEMLFGAKETFSVGIEGMMCMHCVAHVKKAFEALKGVKAVEVSLEEKKATVTAAKGSVTSATLEACVRDAGYTPVSVEEI
jgi:heavy metal translocating P-type ATPase